MDVFQLLEHHEGFSSKPYRCPAGKLTIGFGRNLDDKGITRGEAWQLLRNDVVAAVEGLRQESYWLDLNEPRQAVLIDMVVNLGWKGFQSFKKMRAALSAGDYKAAADQMVDSAWYAQVGQRSKRLVGMMHHGIWPATLSP